MSTRTATEEGRAGLGLMAWLEDTRVRLPLKGVEARFDVRGEFAAVELDQIYHQTATRALDCTCVFPPPEPHGFRSLFHFVRRHATNDAEVRLLMATRTGSVAFCQGDEVRIIPVPAQ